jgi:hypothetical protein
VDMKNEALGPRYSEQGGWSILLQDNDNLYDWLGGFLTTNQRLDFKAYITDPHQVKTEYLTSRWPIQPVLRWFIFWSER